MDRGIGKSLAKVMALTVALSVFAAGNAQAVEPECKDYYGDPLPPHAVVRMGSLQLRQEDARIAFSADGKTLISASNYGGVRCWDMRTGGEARPPRTLMPKPQEWERGSAFLELSPDGKVAVVPVRESLLLYDTATGKELRRLTVGPDLPRSLSVHFHGESLAPESLVFSRDGKTLAYRLWIKDHFVLRLWDVSTGKERPAPSLKAFVGNVAFFSDGMQLASWDSKSGLRLWDTASGRELRHVAAERQRLAFSPDGKTFVAWFLNGSVTLWDTTTLKKQATLKLSVASPHSSGLIWSADSTLLAVAEEKDVVLWDVAASKELRRLPSRKTQRLAFASDGKTLACAGECTINLWDTATGAALHRRPGHDAEVRSVAVSPDGKIVVSTCWPSPFLRLWDAATGKPLSCSPKHEGGAFCCAFSRDSKWLVSGGRDSVRLWTADGKELRHFVIKDVNGEQGKGTIVGCHLSADGERVAAIRAIWNAKQNNSRLQVNVWDARTAKLLMSRPVRGARSTLSSRFSTDGDTVTMESWKGLILEDTRTGQERVTIPGDLGNPVAFSPDDNLLAVGLHKSDEWNGALSSYQSKGFRVAERVTGAELFHVENEGGIEFAAFSPDGRVLATVDKKFLCLWNATTGERLFQRSWPTGLAYSPGGRPISCFAFMPNGKAVVTGMGDGTLLIWDLAAAAWPKPMAARDLDPKELNTLWSDLGSDARKAHRAIPILGASPQQALPFLADHLRPVAVVEAKRVDKLLRDLDSDQFAVRDAADRELNQLGEQIEPALRRTLEGKPSLEVRKRIQTLLAPLHGVPPAETLRTLRVIGMLERIGTAEARRILQKLAGGAPDSRQTREATAALTRLARRSASRP